jgi:hypothetical protein
VGLVALAVALSAMPAQANHPGVFCDGVSNHGISNNAIHWPVRFQWINYSFWISNLDYIALRKDGQGNITFRQFYPGGVQGYTTTSNGYDRFRTTGIQRAGYSFATYSLEQWSHDGCAS